MSLEVAHAPAVWVVTVTYGDRADLVSQVIAAVTESCSIAKTVVVDNGSGQATAQRVDSLGLEAEVIRFSQNVGSAKAFATGLTHAVARGAEYVLLLDDDNVPRPDCVSRLLARLRSLEATYPGSPLAVCGFRSGVTNSQAQTELFSSFLGFEVGGQLGRVLRPRKARASKMLFGPYGGLLLSARTVGIIGLPDERFVLYADDTEYTHRIIENGGMIELVSDAVVDDIDRSWNVQTEYGERGLMRLLSTQSDFRLYYSTRNRVWFDYRKLRRSWLRFHFNMAILIGTLLALAVRHRKVDRLRLIVHAIHDGIDDRLGVESKYPLP